MLRAVAERFESGAITSSSRPSISRRDRRAACSPGAEIPSSLVSRTRMQPAILGGAPRCLSPALAALHTAAVATIRLDLEYDGTGFSGWARQAGTRTVQGELETALGTILR